MHLSDLESIRQQLLDEFDDSTDGPLPVMSGPPMKIELKEGIQPFAVNACPIPYALRHDVSWTLRRTVVIQGSAKVTEPTVWGPSVCARAKVPRRQAVC